MGIIGGGNKAHAGLPIQCQSKENEPHKFLIVGFQNIMHHYNYALKR